MFACSFSFLWGPVNHLRHLFSRDRLPFTAAYFGTLFATLYFALHVQSTPFTVLCAVGQIVALLWFLISYIPGGQTGLQFCTRLFSSAVTSTVSKTLPVWWPLLQAIYCLFSDKALLSHCLMYKLLSLFSCEFCFSNGKIKVWQKSQARHITCILPIAIRQGFSACDMCAVSGM
jgi:hypothetical protein